MRLSSVSIQHPRTDVGPVHGRVATRRPASASAHEAGMILFADDDLSRCALDLGMAFQAQIVVAFHKQFLVDRAMRGMTRRAAFPQRFVFEGKGPGLIAMALRAGLIETRHGQAVGGFADVASVRVVAIDAVHPVFEDRMVMRQIELGMDLEMALVAGRRILAGVEDEFPSSAARGHVLAAGAVTRFASGHARPLEIIFVKPAMRAGRKNPGDVRVAVRATLVPDKGRALDLRRSNDGALQRRARTQGHDKEPDGGQTKPK